MAAGNHWLVKADPDDYGYDDLERDQKTLWTGIRNFEARNLLRQMKPGDPVLVYHSGDEKAVVAIARVTGAPKPDPTAKGEDWSAVELEAAARLKQPVTLGQLKASKTLSKCSLVRRGRLSVHAVTPLEFEAIVSLGDAGSRPPPSRQRGASPAAPGKRSKK